MSLSAVSLAGEGDTILCESPSFVGSLNALKLTGAKLVGIPMDEDGMNLDALKKAIKEYKAEITSIGDAGIDKLSYTEQFFIKLIPTIEKEYADILSDSDNIKTVQIIRWCVKRNLLQQALVLYSEWLPSKIISNIIIKDLEIQKKCKYGNKLEWVSWEQYFIRSYSKAANENRGELFKNLFAEGKIAIKKKSSNDKDGKIFVENFKTLINSYNEVVGLWRNPISHGNAQTKGKETRENISSLILETLDLLDNLNNSK
jgi:hypothetical protein